MFNTLEELKGLTPKEIITKISQSTSISPIDEKVMVTIAKKIGYPGAQVTCGIIYLEAGEQPLGVNQFAEMIVKMGK
jgi:hypothetical protein